MDQLEEDSFVELDKDPIEWNQKPLTFKFSDGNSTQTYVSPRTMNVPVPEISDGKREEMKE